MVLPGKGTGRPAVRGIHNSYCAGVGVYSPHTCAHRNLAAETGGPERRRLPRWGFAVAAVAACRVALVAEAIEHRTATVAAVAHKEAPAVAHREVFAEDRGYFGMEAALHTGLVAVVALPELLHSLCKIVG